MMQRDERDPHEPRDRVRARRRIVFLAGLGSLVVASLTACIFDRSSYQGGGRSDQGASQTASGAASATATDTGTTTSTTPTSTSTSPVDAGPG